MVAINTTRYITHFALFSKFAPHCFFIKFKAEKIYIVAFITPSKTHIDIWSASSLSITGISAIVANVYIGKICVDKNLPSTDISTIVSIAKKADNPVVKPIKPRFIGLEEKATSENIKTISLFRWILKLTDLIKLASISSPIMLMFSISAFGATDVIITQNEISTKNNAINENLAIAFMPTFEPYMQTIISISVIKTTLDVGKSEDVIKKLQ